MNNNWWDNIITKLKQNPIPLQVQVQTQRSIEDTELILKQYKIDNFQRVLIECGVPKIFLSSELSSNYNLKSLYLYGGCGVGKTYKAVSMLKSYLNNLSDSEFQNSANYPIFITVPELLLKIRSCISLNQCEEDIVEKYGDCMLLVLDDLGVEKTTEWALQTLYIILNRRSNNNLTTIITSNLSLEEIGNKIGDRIASRIAGMCTIMHLKGKDRRLNQ